MKIRKIRLAWLGMAVLAFGMVFAGCGDGTFTEPEGFMFKFRVDNYTSETFTKVEFINGDLPNDNALSWTVYNLAPGQSSSIRSVRGFTIEDGEDNCIFGVKVTYSDNTFDFAYDSAKDKSKISVSVRADSPHIRFSEGHF